MNPPHKWPVTWKIFPFNDVMMAYEVYSKQWLQNHISVKLQIVSANVSREYQIFVYLIVTQSLLGASLNSFCVDTRYLHGILYMYREHSKFVIYR